MNINQNPNPTVTIVQIYDVFVFQNRMEYFNVLVLVSGFLHLCIFNVWFWNGLELWKVLGHITAFKTHHVETLDIHTYTDMTASNPGLGSLT